MAAWDSSECLESKTGGLGLVKKLGHALFNKRTKNGEEEK